MTQGEKTACILGSKKLGHVIRPYRRVTAEALVRNGYARWTNEGRCLVQITDKGLRYAATGEQ